MNTRSSKTNEASLAHARNGAADEQAIRSFDPWFHNLHLPGGVQTAPDHPLGDYPNLLWQKVGPRLPDDLHGWRVLDIGCNAGFFSFELAKRGAEVLGIDIVPHYLEQARWARGILGLEERMLRFECMGVYDLPRLQETFDLVWFTGVFYHLRYPLLGLDLAAAKTRRLLVFQSMMMPGREVAEAPQDLPLSRRSAMLDKGWPRMAFIEHRVADDPTNWWAPNHACVLAMLRSAGLRPKEICPPEAYICEVANGGAPEDVTAAANAARSACSRQPSGH